MSGIIYDSFSGLYQQRVMTLDQASDEDFGPFQSGVPAAHACAVGWERNGRSRFEGTFQ